MNIKVGAPYIKKGHTRDPLPAIAAGKTGRPETITKGGEYGVGTIKFSDLPTADDAIVLNGVSVAFGAGNDVAIGQDLTTTVSSLVTFLNASENEALTPATYSKSGTDTLVITYDTKTTESGDYTIDVSGLTAEPTAYTETVENGAASPAIDLSTQYTQLKNTRASVAETATLPDGEEGQSHTIYCAAVESGGSIVVTPDTAITGGTALTFDAKGEFADLKWLAGAWRVIAISSGVLA